MQPLESVLILMGNYLVSSLGSEGTTFCTVFTCIHHTAGTLVDCKWQQNSCCWEEKDFTEKCYMYAIKAHWGIHK